MTALSTTRAAAVAATHFGISGEIAELPGEVDSNYRIRAGDRSYVLKISPETTSASLLAARQFAMTRLAAADLPYEFPHPPDGGADIVALPEGGSATMATWVEGTDYAAAGRPIGLAAEIGLLAGSVVRTLEGFDHPALHYESHWDLAAAPAVLRSLADHVRDPFKRALIDDVRDHLMVQAPQLQKLTKQVIHGDINDLNIIVADGRVAGLIDFGDLIHSWRIAEVAIAATYTMLGQNDPLGVAGNVVSGYASVMQLSSAEATLIYDLIRARLAVSACVAASRTELGNPHHTVSEADVWELLERLDFVDSIAAAAELADAGGKRPADPAGSIHERRASVLGEALSLSYDTSESGALHIVRGEGVHLYDAFGRRYLDCVNNVAHVGHGNIDVVEAAADQMMLLNTNTRYLHDTVIKYAERLLATLPAGFDVVYFVNSGSEANELALRMARTATGRHGMAVLDHGYHGNTSTMIDMSAYKFNGPGGSGPPDWVTVLPLADPYRPLEGAGAYHDRVVELLDSKDPVAGLLAESIVGCGGQVIPDSGDMQAIYDAVRERGGICIADEVQTGFGRVGSHFWSFQIHNLVPDIVTMGKPIGNGHPLGAVATKRAVAEAFANGMEYFNTFGGNPVSAAAGLAVLGVIEDEELQENAATVGAYLLDELRALMALHPAIGDVRGAGLFIGVELVEDRESRRPDGALAAAVVNRAKENGVLLSIDGPHHNVIKIKPPIIFSEEDADQLVAAMDAALAAV